MKFVERFSVAVAATLLLGILVLGTAPASPTPAAQLRPEQISTMPAQIQAQIARTSSIATGNVQPAPANVRKLRPEQVLALPPQIQDQVRGTSQARAAVDESAGGNTSGAEEIGSLSMQIQDQVRRSMEDRLVVAPASARSLRAEHVMSLPWKIQAQVHSDQLASASMLGPEEILALPPQIQEQVRGASQ